MAKRSAVEQPRGASPSKKLHLDMDLDDEEDDQFTPQTPMSSIDAGSPNTTVTTPRARFPSDLKTLACTWPGCTKTFNRPARLRDHLNSHTNSRPFKCPYEDCDKDYTVDKHLKQHIKATHTHERRHVCQREGCGKSFVTGTRLKRHQAVHEGADRFRCQECGQSFRKKDTLSKHVRKEHEGLPSHPCPEPGCNEAFHTKSSLKRHQDREHGELRFWCGECGVIALDDGTERRVGFTTETLLQAHLKREHQNCMFCDFKSTKQGELEKHVEMHHSGKTMDDRKTEECPYPNCGKKFTNKSNRNNHVRTAHEGFRYVCGEVELAGPDFENWSNDHGCGDKFAAKARLEDHVRYVHLGVERPRLSSKKPLGVEQSHPQTLIDDLSGFAAQKRSNVPCSHCPATFIRYADLEFHMDRAHNASDSDTPLFHGDELTPPMFGEDPLGSTWPEEMGQEEIFAAEMDYGPVDDGWAEDEANIMLLARDAIDNDPAIDPTLQAL